MSEEKKVHVPLPKETRAFVCANCGAVALDQNNICKVQGMVKKADWCGSAGVAPPSYCHNKVHTDRYQCKKCGKVAINSELLCEPQKLEIPK
ncbi:MAG: hypothetical protein HY807_07465 [Nitrospirae bacterium]|nr:hypothetical protein [Nitrospirota bacterium]